MLSSPSVLRPQNSAPSPRTLAPLLGPGPSESVSALTNPEPPGEGTGSVPAARLRQVSTMAQYVRENHRSPVTVADVAGVTVRADGSRLSSARGSTRSKRSESVTSPPRAWGAQDGEAVATTVEHSCPVPCSAAHACYMSTMLRSVLTRSALALAATTLALTACGGEQGQSPAAGSDGEGAPASGSLRISLEGEDTEFTPEIVRCTGEPGTIRDVVITMREDLPLLKVTPGEFAMLKLHQQGPPEESDSTDGITAEDGTIRFDEVSIGGAVVDGTVECLQGDS